ncbi:RNA-binding protein [Rhodovibrionaceae bacterium A322]
MDEVFYSDEPEKGPTRRCLVSGERRGKEEMIRFVLDPEGCLVPDLAGRLPGRGLWLLADRAVFEKACQRRLFARAARAKVEVPDGLGEEVTRQLRRRVLDQLGLARRAGEVVAGHDKVRVWLEQGKAALLMQASDGAEAPRRRLEALGRGHRPDLEVIEEFEADALGFALGRSPTVHVALLPGGAAKRLTVEFARLVGFGTPGSDVARK